MPWDNRQDGIKQGKGKKSAFSVSSTAGMKHDQMQLEEGRVNISLQLGGHTPSLTEVRGHRDTLLTGLLLVAFSVCFPGLPAQRWHPYGGWALPHQS